MMPSCERSRRNPPPPGHPLPRCMIAPHPDPDEGDLRGLRAERATRSPILRQFGVERSVERRRLLTIGGFAPIIGPVDEKLEAATGGPLIEGAPNSCPLDAARAACSLEVRPGRLQPAGLLVARHPCEGMRGARCARR
jgi:hypothetical protein